MSRVCVLVAEDQPDYLQLLEIVLTGEGFYVATAEDGQKAVDLLKEFRPAILLTDLMMPNLNGIDLIRHVREKNELKDTPIIVMTAADSGNIEEARRVGANEVLMKPMEFEMLVTTLKKYLGPQHPTLAT